jgi:hypothetical protein
LRLHSIRQVPATRQRLSAENSFVNPVGNA